MQIRSRCLNCGRELNDGRFCPHCGQSRSVGRLTLGGFLFSLISGLTHINQGFLYTCGKLLTQPWDVIRDYLIGKRQPYTSPVQTLIILCFISVILSSWFGEPASENEVNKFAVGNDNYLGFWVIQSIRWYVSSPTIQNLTLFVPAIPAFMLVTSHRGKCKYNIAECLLAAIYTSSSIFLFRLIIYPVQLLFGCDITWFTLVYAVVIGCVGVSKSVMNIVKTRFRIMLRIVSFFGVSLINYIAIAVAIAILTYYTVIK